jgi:hypothetical protein
MSAPRKWQVPEFELLASGLLAVMSKPKLAACRPTEVSPPETNAKALSPGRMPVAGPDPQHACFRVGVVPPVVPAPTLGHKEIMFMECLP